MSQQEANQIAQETQRMLRSRRVLKLALPTAAALGAGAAIAVAAIPGSDGTITGCYANPTGTNPNSGLANNATVNTVVEPPGSLRVIDPSLPHTLKAPSGAPIPNAAAVCEEEEKQITWNQSGPQGPAGVNGGQGAAGGQGVPGAPGAHGELVPAVQFGFDNSAGKMFLKLDGVKGESTDSKHKGDIEISSFSFGAGNGGAQAHGGGGGAGKVSFSSFTITKHLDKSSPLLQKAVIGGQHYKEADVFFARKAGKGQQDYLKIKLTDVLVSSYQTGGHGGSLPTETIALDGIKGEATFINGHKLSNIALKLQPGA
jgi:type VI secretion system secreted protein Hcp